MRFICVIAWLDLRYDAPSGSPIADVSREGEERSGRGCAIIGTAGRLVGQSYIHNGDGSGVVCERC